MLRFAALIKKRLHFKSLAAACPDVLLTGKEQLKSLRVGATKL